MNYLKTKLNLFAMIFKLLWHEIILISLYVFLITQVSATFVIVFLIIGVQLEIITIFVKVMRDIVNNTQIFGWMRL